MDLVACHSCGYNIERWIGVRCSECGWIYDHAASQAQVARDVVIAAGGRPAAIQTMAWVGVLFVYSVGATVAGGQAIFLPATAIMLGVGLAVSFLVGLGLTMLTPAYSRRLAMAVWLRNFPILHGPWLVIGGFTAVGVLAGGLSGRLLGPEGAGLLLWKIGLVAFFAWLVLIPVWVLAWVFRSGVEVKRLGIAESVGSVWRVLTLLWAIVVVLVCAAVGLGGGYLGFWFALDMAGAGDYVEWDF